MTYRAPAVTHSAPEIVTRLHHCTVPFPGYMSFVLFKDYIKFNAGDGLLDGFSVRSSSDFVEMSQLSFSSPWTRLSWHRSEVAFASQSMLRLWSVSCFLSSTCGLHHTQPASPLPSLPPSLPPNCLSGRVTLARIPIWGLALFHPCGVTQHSCTLSRWLIRHV